MYEQEKKVSKSKEVLENIMIGVVMLAGAVLILGSLFLFFIFFICLFQGEFMYALYSLGGLAVTVGIFSLIGLHISRKGKKQREAERAANITEHIVDCGRFGELVFEHDKRYKSDTLQGGLFPIFSENENAKLVFCAMDADGRLVERILDRIEADRDVITEGVIRRFERYCEKTRDTVSGDFQGIKLDEVTIEESGGAAYCEFDIIGISDVWLTAEFSPDKKGYRFEAED